MFNFKSWKPYTRALIGGAVIFVVGNFLVPVINQLLVFIPQTKLFFNGLTPHVIVAYGIGYLVADWVNERFLKM